MRRISFGPVIGLLIAAVGASSLAGSLETVTVTGTRAVSDSKAARSIVGAPVRDITVSYGVSVADLDLTTAAGQTELQKRVKAAAQAACKEIDKIAFGDPSSPDDAICVKKAVEDALAKARGAK